MAKYITIFAQSIYVYDIFQGLSIGAALAMGIYCIFKLEKDKGNRKNALIMMAAIVATVWVGSKMVYKLMHWKDFAYLFNFSQGGQNFVGGYFLLMPVYAILYGIIYKNNPKGEKKYFRLIYYTAALMLMQAVGRIGCISAGCCFGKESSGIFAIKSNSIRALDTYGSGAGFLPTQPIDSIVMAIFSIILLWIVMKNVNKDSGYFKEIFSHFLVIYGIYGIAFNAILDTTTEVIVLGVITVPMVCFGALAVLGLAMGKIKQSVIGVSLSAWI